MISRLTDRLTGVRFVRRRGGGLRALLLVLVVMGQVARADVEWTVAVGRVDQSGFLQTPTGGAPGTATLGRPSVEELDLDGANSFLLGAEWSNDRWFVRAHYDRFHVDGDSVLGASLIMQGRPFGEGSSVAAELDLHELAAAVGRRGRAGDLDWWAGVRVGATDFSVSLDSSGVPSPVDRAYHVIDVAGLLGASLRLGPAWSVDVEALLAPQHERFAGRRRLDGYLVYQLDRLAWRVGIRLETFEYDDAYKQALPNHLDLDRVVPRIGVSWRL